MTVVKVRGLNLHVPDGCTVEVRGDDVIITPSIVLPKPPATMLPPYEPWWRYPYPVPYEVPSSPPPGQGPTC